MVWIKRNLLFVLSAVVGLILMVGSGCFFYGNWSANRKAVEDFKRAQSELKALQNKKPFPTKEAIQEAKEAQKEVLDILYQFKAAFESAQETPSLDEKTFKSSVSGMLAQLQTLAVNSGVNLPQSDYAFSFSGLITKLNFPTNSIGPWVMQLHDVKSICSIVFNAKVNTLEGIRRVPVSTDEAAVGAGDFLPLNIVTNENIARAPYEVVVRGYSREIADVMNGFLRSTDCFIIKNIDIGPASGAAGIAATQTGGASVDANMPSRRREGRSEGGTSVGSRSNSQAPVTMVSEGMLRVVIWLESVKLKTLR